MTKTCDQSCTCDTTSVPGPASAPVTPGRGQWVSRYRVPKMDCPSEERMIRLALEDTGSVLGLRFDLPQRQLDVIHRGESALVTERLVSLGLGASLQETKPATQDILTTTSSASAHPRDDDEAHTLQWLLGINGLMFVLEFAVGWWAQSAGLIADSLDMFADAAVYGLSLYAVGKTASLKLRAAHLSGLFQLTLALGVLLEVGRRFVFGSDPYSSLMIGMACLALLANVTCLWMISRRRDNGVHMKASWIFSANDVLANIGVITAGILVAWTQSRYPDLIIGIMIGLLVLNGTRRILALKA